MGERFGTLNMKRFKLFLLCLVVLGNFGSGRAHGNGFGEQPLSKIAIHKATIALSDFASVKAYPFVLGSKVIAILTLIFFFGCVYRVLERKRLELLSFENFV